MTQTKIGVGMINATSIGDAKVLQGNGAWVTPSAGALTFISNTDISSAATYDFTSFTAGSYEHYQFWLQNLIPATDDVHLWVRLSTDAGSSYDSGSSDYGWTGGNYSGASTNGIKDTDTADAQISLTGDSTDTNITIGSSGTESGASGVIRLFGPHTTSFTHVHAQLTTHSAANFPAYQTFSGIRLTAADVDGFRILFESGNIESGTITAYGLANS